MKYPHLLIAAVEIGYDNGCFNRMEGCDHWDRAAQALATLEESLGTSKLAAAESELSQLSIEALITSCVGEGGESSVAPGGAADTTLNQLFEEL